MIRTNRLIHTLVGGGAVSAFLLGAFLTSSVSGYGEVRRPSETAGHESQEAEEAIHGFELSDLDGVIRSSDEWQTAAGQLLGHLVRAMPDGNANPDGAP